MLAPVVDITARPAPAAPPAPTRPPAVCALLRLLDQLAGLVRRLPDALFVQPAPGQASGSVGAHVRHTLDHVEALLDALDTGRLNYDHRTRGTREESSRAHALERMARLAFAAGRLGAPDLARPVRLTALVDGDGATISVVTTIARELAFVLSHTIHHNGTMAVMLQSRGVTPPGRFGYAPSTPTPEAARVTCAR